MAEARCKFCAGSNGGSVRQDGDRWPAAVERFGKLAPLRGVSKLAGWRSQARARFIWGGWATPVDD